MRTKQRDHISSNKETLKNKEPIENSLNKASISNNKRSKFLFHKRKWFEVSISAIIGFCMPISYEGIKTIRTDKLAQEAIQKLDNKYNIEGKKGINDYPALLKNIEDNPKYKSEYNFFYGYYLLQSDFYQRSNELGADFYFRAISPTSKYYNTSLTLRYNHLIDLKSEARITERRFYALLEQILIEFEANNSFSHNYFYLYIERLIGDPNSTILDFYDTYLRFQQEIKVPFNPLYKRVPKIKVKDRDMQTFVKENYAYLLQERAIQYLFMLNILAGSPRNEEELKIQIDMCPYLVFENEDDMNNHIQTVELGLNAFIGKNTGETILKNLNGLIKEKYNLKPAITLKEYRPANNYVMKVEAIIPVDDADEDNKPVTQKK
ncbi:hypothetical protein [Dysgonomonas sp. BGC7]|uniref:hypothetical protein n=1 Tax=Dysgonomonas sp. BGC7 TaxID=1658008 RepID=UPI00068281CF|nr:hypothetical protein [Dysgonomonas sp. BGC7]MBD8388040.1 hypothetical protein [Dysgonomonas sp. BGC7]